MKEQLDSIDETTSTQLKAIVQSRADQVQQNNQMMELEEESYKRTITNQAKVSIRERLTELLPELVTAVQTKSAVHA